jgi:DNA-binding CsgD family transcriptional regulator
MAGRHKHRFVGRAAELAGIEQEWHNSAAGQFRCVLLLGEPGIGKTRLADESVARCASGATVLRAHARPLSGTSAFGVWAEALERHLRDWRPQEIADLCGHHLDDLAGLVHSVAVARGLAPRREPPRPRLLGAISRLVANLAERGPLILLLDDLHQADPSSWDALAYLSQAIPDRRVLVVATARAAELAALPAPLRVLVDLEERDALRRVEVEPLDARALRELAEDVLARPVSKDMLDWLCDRSRGVPLYAVGLLHAVNDEGGPVGAGLRLLPEGLTERVQVRLGQLDDEAQGVLEVVAVAGGQVGLGELVRYANRPLEQLAPTIDKLVRSRLLAEVETGRIPVYEIAHPLIGETVYRQIGGARRFALHRHVGRTLLVSGRLGEAALHFARSATPGDDEAIQVLLDALAQAEQRGAHREVLRILGSLIDVVPSGDQRWAQVADALLGDAEWVVDHRADDDARAAVSALEKIDAVLASGPDQRARAAVKARLASLLSWGCGEPRRAAPLALEAARLYADAGEGTRARLAELEAAYAQGLAGDVSALRSGAAAVLERAESAGDEEAALWAVGVHGSACFYQGNFAAAETALRRAVAMGRAQDRPYRLTWSAMALGWSLGYEGRLAEAYQAFETARSTPAWRESNALELEANVRWLGGDLAGSLACARDALKQNPGRIGRRRGQCLASLALAAIETGELAEARRAIAAARQIYGAETWFMAGGQTRHAEGVLAWREGRLAEAAGLLQQAAAELHRVGAPVMAAFVLLDLCELSAVGGPVDAATGDWAVATMAAVAADTDRALYRGAHRLSEAWHALRMGQPGSAAEAADAAVAEFRPLGYAVLTARALVARGAALADRDPRGSIVALGAGAELLAAAGAEWRRDLALARLRRGGRSGKQVAAATLGARSITGRELEVARLGANRLSSAEIAARLFISHRTVETHLASVYTKLQVNSRSGLADKLAELSL